MPLSPDHHFNKLFKKLPFYERLSSKTKASLGKQQILDPKRPFLLQLPDELLLAIERYLDPKDAFKLSLVARKLRRTLELEPQVIAYSLRRLLDDAYEKRVPLEPIVEYAFYKLREDHKLLEKSHSALAPAVFEVLNPKAHFHRTQSWERCNSLNGVLAAFETLPLLLGQKPGEDSHKNIKDKNAFNEWSDIVYSMRFREPFVPGEPDQEQADYARAIEFAIKALDRMNPERWKTGFIDLGEKISEVLREVNYTNDRNFYDPLLRPLDMLALERLMLNFSKVPEEREEMLFNLTWKLLHMYSGGPKYFETRADITRTLTIGFADLNFEKDCKTHLLENEADRLANIGQRQNPFFNRYGDLPEIVKRRGWVQHRANVVRAHENKIEPPYTYDPSNVGEHKKTFDHCWGRQILKPAQERLYQARTGTTSCGRTNDRGPMTNMRRR